MGDAGRSPHNNYEALGFTLKRLQVNGKSTNVASCWQCGKDVTNTAIKRLKSHRNICVLSLSTMKKADENHKDQNGQKRKARESLASSLANDSNDSLLSNHNDLGDFPRAASESETQTELMTDSQGETSKIISESQTVNNNNELNPWKNTKNKNKKIKSFIDEVDEGQLKLINQKLLQLCIGCDIDLSIVESKYFLSLIQVLRPAYLKCLPSKDDLESTIFLKLYDEHMKKNVVASQVLVVYVPPENVHGCLTFTISQNGSYHFLHSKCDNQNLKVFVFEELDSFHDKNKCEMISIISNCNDLFDSCINVRENFTFFYFLCLSEIIAKIFYRAVPKELIDQVNELHVEFNIPILKEKYDYSCYKIEGLDTYLVGLINCSNNLKAFCDIVSKKIYSCDKKYYSLLFDSEFDDKLKNTINFLKKLEVLLEKDLLQYTQADLVQDWLLLIAQVEDISFKRLLEDESDFICNSISLTANFLNPCYKGNLFANNENYKAKIIHTILEHTDDVCLESFYSYRDNFGIFKTLYQKNIRKSDVFWQTAETEHKLLAKFSMNLLKIPAFCNTHKFSISSDYISNLPNKKFKELYYALKINA